MNLMTDFHFCTIAERIGKTTSEKKAVLLSISHSPFATYDNDHFDINRCIVKF